MEARSWLADEVKARVVFELAAQNIQCSYMEVVTSKSENAVNSKMQPWLRMRFMVLDRWPKSATLLCRLSWRC